MLQKKKKAGGGGGSLFIGLDSAQETGKVADSVFNVLFEQRMEGVLERLGKQESQSFQIMLGSVIAAFLILAALIWGAWEFIGEYNQHYLDAQKSFLDEINILRKENFELKDTLSREINDIKSKQGYLERFILNSKQ